MTPVTGRLGRDKQPPRIAGMFDAIAPRYDLLNHLLSGGLDLRWRAKAVRALALRGGETVLDLCTGTADLAIAAATASPGAAAVVGVDFAGADAPARPRQTRRRAASTARVRLVQGDAMRIPLASASVDAATVAFGIRNVERPEDAFADVFRVLRPGGRFAILEFGVAPAAGRAPGLSGLLPPRAAEGRLARVRPFVGVHVPAGVGGVVPGAGDR